MELLYLWIDNAGINLQNREVKFTSEFNFTLKRYNIDPNGVRHLTSDNADRYTEVELHVEDNPRFIQNFFGEAILNVTGIIGKNGSGKSNLLDFVTRLLTNETSIGERFIAVFKLKHLLVSFHTLYKYSFEGDRFILGDITDVSVKSEAKRYRTLSKGRIIPIRKNIDGEPTSISISCLQGNNVIFYSPLFDLRRYPITHSNPKEFNVSTNFLLYKDYENRVSDKFDQVATHRYKNVERQFVYVYSQSDSLKHIRLPEAVEIKFERSLLVKDNLGYDGNQMKDHLHKLIAVEWKDTETQLGKARESGNKELYNSYLRQRTRIGFLDHFVSNFFYLLNEDQDFDQNLLEITKGDITGETGSAALQDFLSKQDWIDSQFLLDFVNTIGDIILNKGLVEYEATYESISFERLDASTIWSWMMNYREKFGGYAADFIKMNWRDMSSGEKAYLDLFSRIYHARDLMLERAIKDENESNSPVRIPIIYLLIDEGEVGFHPEWQLAYLERLLHGLRYLFKAKHTFENTRIQLILTSHSPFLVSDLPKENIVFYDESTSITGHNHVAFGSNIHTLFADTFMLPNGLTGKFAEKRISQLISWLRGEKDPYPYDQLEFTEDRARKLIDIIDDPIVSGKLLEMYYERFGINDEEYRRIMRQRDELDNLLRKLNKG